METLYSVDENDGSIAVTVAVLSGELSEDVVVGFNTQDDTATGLATHIHNFVSFYAFSLSSH